ncbi:MAG: GntR family transcriptional regulator [Anaerolineae bacterium]|nr:GntR family transcriptional regulator [Anaerolineae bacterium]
MEINHDRRSSKKELQVRLAEYLIQLEEGNKLPSIRKLASTTHMSLGSVSSALNDLQEMGAVSIQKRGHLGSIVEKISMNKLWNVIEPGPLVIAMTLPMHLKFEGLATGLKMAFENAGIDAYMIFIRGSLTRLKALRENRCHVAVMSGMAAEALCDEGLEIVLTLPAGSWISGYTVFYRDLPPGCNRPLRVAVDTDSQDHRRLNDLEFAGQAVEYRYESFVKFSRLLRNGDADAAIWTVDQEEAYLGADIKQRPLSEHVMKKIGEKSLSATFIARAGHGALRALFTNVIDPQTLLQVQAKVVAGEMVPGY